MKRSHAFCLATALALGAIAIYDLPSTAAESARVQSSPTIGDDLSKAASHDLLERSIANSELARERDIASLLAIARMATGEDAIGRERRAYAFYLLGVFRAAEAAPELAKQIAFESRLFTNGGFTSRIPRWSTFPAKDALVRIGSAGTDAVLANLATTDTTQERSLLLAVLREVYGANVAPAVLQRAIERETDPTKKARLVAANVAL